MPPSLSLYHTGITGRCEERGSHSGRIGVAARGVRGGGAEEEEDGKRVLFLYLVGKGKEGQKTTDRRDGAHGPSDVEGREGGSKEMTDQLSSNTLVRQQRNST